MTQATIYVRRTPAGQVELELDHMFYPAGLTPERQPLPAPASWPFTNSDERRRVESGTLSSAEFSMLSEMVGQGLGVSSPVNSGFVNEVQRLTKIAQNGPVLSLCLGHGAADLFLEAAFLPRASGKRLLENLSYRFDLPFVAPAAATTWPLRILLLRANPANLGGAVPEAITLQARLQELLPGAVQVDLLSNEDGAAGKPTLAGLQQQLAQQRYAALIYLGHSTRTELLLEPETGPFEQPLTSAGLLEALDRNLPQLVLLASCLSAASLSGIDAQLQTRYPDGVAGLQGIAQDLVQQRPALAAIGMRMRLEGEAAETLILEFVRNLLRPDVVDRRSDHRAVGDLVLALGAAQRTLQAQPSSRQPYAWLAPVLYAVKDNPLQLAFLRTPIPASVETELPLLPAELLQLYLGEHAERFLATRAFRSEQNLHLFEQHAPLAPGSNSPNNTARVRFATLQQPKSSLLFAPRGYGKTSYLQAVARSLASRRRFLVAILDDFSRLLGNTPEQLEARIIGTLLDALCQAIWKGATAPATLNWQALQTDNARPRLVTLYALLRQFLRDSQLLPTVARSLEQAILVQISTWQQARPTLLRWLELLREVAEAAQFKGIALLIDRVDEFLPVEQAVESIAPLLRPGVFEPGPNIVLKFFVSDQLAPAIDANKLTPSPAQVFHIPDWTAEELCAWLQDRWSHYGRRGNAAPTSMLSDLFAEDAQDGCLRLAAQVRSPRELLERFTQVLEEHLNEGDPLNTPISSATIEAVV